MGRSRRFASTAADLPPLRAGNALFRLGFPTAPARKALTDRPTTVTPRIIMQKARRQALPLRAIALRPLVGAWFQVLFTPLGGGSFHLSVALLSSLSVIREYLALRDGPRSFGQGSTCPDLLRYLPGDGWLSCTGLSPSLACLSSTVPLASRFVTPMWKALQPRGAKPHGLGCSPFARRY